MCSQDNLTWCSKNYSDIFGFVPGKDTVISYLPLNHITGQMTDIYVGLSAALTVYFAEPDALKGSLINTLREVNPTGFLTVPRLLERMQENVNAALAEAGPAKQLLMNWAKNQSLAYHNVRIEGGKPSLMERVKYELARALVLEKVKAALGLGNSKYLVVGSAPLSNSIMDYFLSLDMPVTIAFGLSETQSSGSMSFLSRGTYRKNSVGKNLPIADIEVHETNEVRILINVYKNID